MKFSLRSLLLAVLAIGAALAWRANWESWVKVQEIDIPPLEPEIHFARKGKELRVFQTFGAAWTSLVVDTGRISHFEVDDNKLGVLICVSNDREYVAYQKDKLLCIYKITAPRSPWVTESPKLSNAIFSRDSFLLIGHDMDSSIWKWNFMVDGQMSLLADRRPHGPLATSPDNRLLAMGEVHGEIRLVDVQTKRELSHWSGYSSLTFLDFCNQGEYLVGTTADGAAALWRISDGKALLKWPSLDPQRVIMGLSSDSQSLAYVKEESQPVWVDLTKLNERTFDPIKSKIDFLQCSVDGRELVAALDPGMLAFWDTLSGKLVARLETGAGRIEDLRLSPDGRHLAIRKNRKNIVVLYRQRHRRYGRAWLYPEAWITFLAVLGLVWSLRRDGRELRLKRTAHTNTKIM